MSITEAISLEPNENILKQEPAAYRRADLHKSAGKTKGKLILTDKRLIFAYETSFLFFFMKDVKQKVIPFDNIEKISKVGTLRKALQVSYTEKVRLENKYRQAQFSGVDVDAWVEKLEEVTS